MDVQKREIPQQVSGYILEELDGQLLIFDQESGRIVEVNQTAALIWQLCDGNLSLAELSDLIAAAYPDAGDRVKEDIDQSVRELVEVGVLRLQPAKNP